MSTYGDRVHECDRCHLGTHSELGELLPDGWRNINGQEVCERCSTQSDEAYLRGAGWKHWEYANPDLLPDPGVWADPFRADGSRKLKLAAAVAEQRKRDGYGQLDLLEEAS